MRGNYEIDFDLNGYGYASDAIHEAISLNIMYVFYTIEAIDCRHIDTNDGLTPDWEDALQFDDVDDAHHYIDELEESGMYYGLSTCMRVEYSDDIGLSVAQIESLGGDDNKWDMDLLAVLRVHKINKLLKD